MNYIVMDLEWNQSPIGKQGEVKSLPFEIIEIGAVKLDENYNEIGSFRQLVCPQVYKEINIVTGNLVNISIEDLMDQKKFEKVVQNFFTWCGDNYIFATWGNMDLLELQKNLKYFNIEHNLNKPIFYYNVQKLFALNFFNNKLPRTLQYAVNYLGIQEKEEYHRAYIDAKYTAEILKRIDKKVIQKNISIDCFHNPKTKKEEILLVYDRYTKFISKEFISKQRLLGNRDIISIKCITCNKEISKKVKWYTTNSKTYYCLGKCKEHGYIKGKLRVKKTDNNRYFVIKVVKLISEEDALEFVRNYEIIKEKKSKKD